MNYENDNEYILLDAQDYFNQNNYQKCIDLCQTVLDKDPNNQNANILTAISFQKLKQHHKAIALFEKHLDNTKSQSATWRWYALALFNAAIYDKSETVFQDLAVAYPKDGDVWYSFGYFKLFKKEYEVAIKMFSKSIEIGVIEMHLVYFNRGIAYYNLKEFNSAIADMEKTIELEPEHAEAAAILAEIYKIIGNSVKAIEYYSRSLYFNPENGKLRFNRLTYLLNLKDENGKISYHQMAQQDADKLTPNFHEYIKLTSNEGEPMTVIKVTITEEGAMDFEV